MPTKSKSTGSTAGDKPVKSAFKPITGKKPAAPAEAEEKKPAKKAVGDKSPEKVEKPVVLPARLKGFIKEFCNNPATGRVVI